MEKFVKQTIFSKQEQKEFYLCNSSWKICVLLDISKKNAQKKLYGIFFPPI